MARIGMGALSMKTTMKASVVTSDMALIAVLQGYRNIIKLTPG